MSLRRPFQSDSLSGGRDIIRGFEKIKLYEYQSVLKRYYHVSSKYMGTGPKVTDV